MGENEISKNVTDIQTLHHYIYIVIINDPIGGHLFLNPRCPEMGENEISKNVTDRHFTIIYISSATAIVHFNNAQISDSTSTVKILLKLRVFRFSSEL